MTRTEIIAALDHRTGSDAEVTNHGSIITILPLTEAAQEWMAENIPEDAQWFAGALAVEPRYVEAILRGMADDGLILSP